MATKWIIITIIWVIFILYNKFRKRTADNWLALGFDVLWSFALSAIIALVVTVITLIIF